MLRQVQMQTVANRLSERNCVSLVQQLMEREMVTLVYTQSGKEYLTLPRLQEEILDELMAHSGRIKIQDLPSLLDVDAVKIEAQIPEIVKSGKAVSIEGHLIAEYVIHTS